jgi:gentisate 1,2-dioxygenase
VLGPQRTWHHHENPSDEPVIWLDAIDTPFVRNMNAIFYEQYGTAIETLFETMPCFSA